MKNENKFLIIFIIILLLTSLSHEFVHQAIFESYDINGNVSLFYFQPEENCPTEECILANSINEVIEYNLVPLFILIGMGFYFLIKEK